MSPKSAILAGVVASLVLAAALVAESLFPVLPAYDLVGLIQRFTGGPRAAGWLGYALVGVLLWPAVFVLLRARLPGASDIARGLVFGGLAWAAMMLLFLPIAGAGFFGLVIGWWVPVMALLQHLLYGAALGLVYRPQAPPRNRRRRR
ncbi:DUF6789 family protein [Salinisphaera sp. Q1T1-3]|uniref:DUF6789 family protein n=1 Tax=Salinisphaera sp. Q1T1-3 TaxID=2321229 RepID=UPI000E715F25|nr:DUF6789 family protein [Salinisphaera sp. Q1T1-3]RJS94111.1 hypothetical protein D3260_05990 [Salinisphaera sp. Q1T1-3]